MQVNNKRCQIIPLIFLILCSCNLDKKRKANSNVIEEEITADYNTIINQKKIDSLIDNGYPYIKNEFNLNDYSSEGGMVESYLSKKGDLVKIKATYFGHSGKSEWNYYFKNDTLFFVDRQEFRYKTPVLSDKNDIIIDSVLKSKYFLEKGNLIKWLDENKILIDTSSKKFKQENSYLKQDIKEFKKKIKAAN